MRKAVKRIAAVLLVSLIPIGIVRLWSWAQKPILRSQVLARLSELTDEAERTLAARDGLLCTDDMYIPEDGGTIWYAAGGAGFGSSAQYYGYCYSADGDPHPYPGMEDYDETAVMFGFRWNETGGDNGCYLEHIDGNFYFYKVWF